MTILVIAEHDNSTLKSATLNTLKAAQMLGDDVNVLVAGYQCGAVVDQVQQVVGVAKVLVADNEAYAHQLAENTATLVTQIAVPYSHVLASATTTGKNIMPRVAALLDVAQISDITAVHSEQSFERPIYAGNAIATVESLDSIKVITVRTSAFDAVPSVGGSATVETLNLSCNEGLSSFISEELVKSDRPELSSSRVVVSGGRGMGSRENFDLLAQLADKLGGAVGASRAAVDAGFVANDMQVGQTGKIVAPDLYIAVGLSGAIQHLAGMKNSKIIVAINKDEEAPIFSVADYGLVADLFEAVPELVEKL